MSNVVLMSIEIEIPEYLSDELQDAVVDDITEEMNIERLMLMIKHWARKLTGENCHVAIDVE